MLAGGEGLEADFGVRVRVGGDVDGVDVSGGELAKGVADLRDVEALGVGVGALRGAAPDGGERGGGDGGEALGKARTGASGTGDAPADVLRSGIHVRRGHRLNVTRGGCAGHRGEGFGMRSAPAK